MNLRNHQNENIVVLNGNDELVLKVNRKKLLEKSVYFRAVFKECYKYYNSDLIDVYFPEKEEIVDKVMKFISSDSITLDINSIFETYNLAEYLQIGCLQQLCLDHFTLNLNRNTLEKQLDLIAKYSHLNLRNSKRGR